MSRQSFDGLQRTIIRFSGEFTKENFSNQNIEMERKIENEKIEEFIRIEDNVEELKDDLP